MFGIKIIITIIILLLLVMTVIGSHPSVGGFFENIFDRFSGITVFEFDTAQRGVFLNLDVNRFDKMDVKTRRLVNITIIPDTMSISIKDGEIKPDKGLIIYGFRGQISIGEKLNLDGKYDKFEYLDASTSFGSGDIKADGTFAEIKFDNFALNELNLKNVSGNIIANEVETIFSEADIEIKAPAGTFVFNDGLKIDGMAEKVSIPGRNLVIG